jgi:hypothetical protein
MRKCLCGMRKHKRRTRLRQREKAANLPRMTISKAFFVLVCGVLVACGSEPKNEQPKLPDAMAVFPNLPFPPDAKLISRAGSADALQITFKSSRDTAQVAAYYRSMLTAGNWRLISDTKNRDGTLVLYAEQKGPPLWVRIRKAPDGPGTMVELTGAMMTKDTTSRKPTASQSSTTSSR